MVFLPLNVKQKHWVLCVLFPLKRRWVILDSAGGAINLNSLPFIHHMSTWLQERDPNWQQLPDFPIQAETAPQRLNEDPNNCGVYVCLFAELLSVGMTLEELGKIQTSSGAVGAYRETILLTLKEEIPLDL